MEWRAEGLQHENSGPRDGLKLKYRDVDSCESSLLVPAWSQVSIWLRDQYEAYSSYSRS